MEAVNVGDYGVQSKGKFTISESDFFLCYLSLCSMWRLNWILYEPIWKRRRFRFNINEPSKFFVLTKQRWRSKRRYRHWMRAATQMVHSNWPAPVSVRKRFLTHLPVDLPLQLSVSISVIKAFM